MTVITMSRTAKGVVLSFAYDADIVARLKRIPSHWRSYNPGTREWTIKAEEAFLAFVRDVTADGHIVQDRMGKRFGFEPPPRARQEPPPRQAPPRTPPRSAPRSTAQTAWVGQMFDSLPHALHDKAYRALSKVLHPDTGGDAEMMKALNAERDRRKK